MLKKSWKYQGKVTRDLEIKKRIGTHRLVLLDYQKVILHL